MPVPASPYLQEWRRGWPAVLAASLGGGAVTVHFFSMGLFIEPLTQEMGWTVAQATIGILICSIITVPGAPLVGWLVDRIGLGPVLAAGLPLFFISFASIGLLASSYTGWLVAWSLVAVAAILLKSNVWILWIAQEFDMARGMAFAVTMSGHGIFAVFVPSLTYALIASLGWRQAYPVLALLMAAIAVPLCLFAFFMGRRSRARNRVHVSDPGPTAEPKAPATGIGARQALRTRRFWHIMIGALLAGWGIMSVQVFLVPMLREKHFEGSMVAMLAGLLGAAAIAGRILTGLLLDRFSARLIGAVSLLLPVVACLLYLYAPVTWLVAAAVALLFGFALGAESDVMAYLTSRHFGLKNFGTIYGFMAGAIGLGAGAGPYTIALVRDYTGTYVSVAWVVGTAMLISSILIATLGSYPDVAGASGEAGREDKGGDLAGPQPVT